MLAWITPSSSVLYFWHSELWLTLCSFTSSIPFVCSLSTSEKDLSWVGWISPILFNSTRGCFLDFCCQYSKCWFYILIDKAQVFLIGFQIFLNFCSCLQLQLSFVIYSCMLLEFWWRFGLPVAWELICRVVYSRCYLYYVCCSDFSYHVLQF